LIWKKCLDSSSIFSGPISDDLENLFVTTLGSSLFCLDSSNGEQKWSVKVEKPIFTAPIISKINCLIFFGSCAGKFYSINFYGQLVRNRYSLSLYSYITKKRKA
jgi:outer membrane protein assembly factor BamB